MLFIFVIVIKKSSINIKSIIYKIDICTRIYVLYISV
jgi:hypothetical protein